MFISSDIDFSKIEHELVKFNQYIFYDKKVTKLDCEDIREKIENFKSKDNKEDSIISLIIYKNKIIAVSDIPRKDFNMNMFCNYIKCNKEYNNIKIIIYNIAKGKEEIKKKLLKTLYKDVALDKIIVKKIKEKQLLFYFLILIIPLMVSISLLFYGVPFNVIDIISVAKAFIFVTFTNLFIIKFFLTIIFFLITFMFIILLDNKIKEIHKKKIKIFSIVFFILSFIIVFYNIPLFYLISILDILIFSIILYSIVKPFTFIDIYHSYISKYMNQAIIISITILYFLAFSIFSFPSFRQIAYKAYLASTGYPKILKDNKNNKTYYLAYEKRGILYVYDINTSTCKCKSKLNLSSWDKNNDISKICFTNYCIESIFPKEQNITYNINDKNITIMAFDENKFCNQNCGKNKTNETK